MTLEVLWVEAFPSSIALTRYEEREDDEDTEGSVRWGGLLGCPVGTTF